MSNCTNQLLRVFAATMIGSALPSIATANEAFMQEVFAAEAPQATSPTNPPTLIAQPMPNAFSPQPAWQLSDSPPIEPALPSIATADQNPMQAGLAADTLLRTLQVSGSASVADSLEGPVSHSACGNVQAFGGCTTFDGYHGDMNVNYILDRGDIYFFALALNDPIGYQRKKGFAPGDRGDINLDDMFDFDDVGAFFEMMDCHGIIPEPSSILLAGCGIFVVIGSLYRSQRLPAPLAGVRRN